MAVRKKVVVADNTLEMSASERISEYIRENVLECGESTSSLKVVNRIQKGSKVSDSHLEFIMRLLGQLRSDSNGSFSISFPYSLDQERTNMLAEAVANVHGETETILNEVYDMLPVEQRDKGKVIQKQNVLRQLMMGKLENVANARERVENYLSTNGLLYIPTGAFMELKIVGGALVFEEPTGQFWKEGPEIVVDRQRVPTWRANWDLFGRTRLPLVGEEASQHALERVFGLAKSFEEFWKDKTITSTDVILEGFLEWSRTLPGRSTRVLRNNLTEEEMAAIEAEAAQHVSKMMSWK